MNVYWDIDKLPDPPMEPIATMGNLDGVHRGHQIIISKLQEEAERKNAQTLVIVFEPHTRKVVRPKDDFAPLMGLNEKLRRLYELGVDNVLVLPFAEGYAEMTAHEFIEEVLWDPLQIQALYVGPDAGFGKKREGDVRLLSSEGRRLGFHVGIIDPLWSEGQRISSSRVRAALEKGHLDAVNRLIGRHHVISGTVLRGFRRGQEIGFPTANIDPAGTALPPNGVYIGWAYLEDDTRHGTMLNIGHRPTFDGGKLSVEAHLFNFDGNLYGKELRVSVRGKIRDEVEFGSPDALKAQLVRDAVEARKQLGIKKAKTKAKPS
ncbi:MAG: riboflavin kinase/FMN adenylyltransferase [Myxococcota bacterium]|jgi:riboflavin kinase/FMN adenylyltransferase